MTATWQTSPVAPTSPDDFVAAFGIVTFAPGRTRASVRVAVNGDRVKETDEYLRVSFSNATNGHIGGWYGLGFGLIVDDD